MPNVRIPTIAKITHKRPVHSGIPLADIKAARIANGSANTECSNLIDSKNNNK
jgi:hypothetical protein